MASRPPRPAALAGLLLPLAVPPPTGCRPALPVSAAPAAVVQVQPVLVERHAAQFDGRLRLAAIFPTLGRYAVSGIQSHNGVRLAVAEINRRGGVHGRRVQLLEYGTGSYFVDARHAAELAAHEDGALAIVGSNSSSLSKAVAEVAEATRIVQISNVSTAGDLNFDPDTGRLRRFVFRMCSTDETLSRELAVFAGKHLRARRVAVLYEVGRTYSAQMARGFVARFADPAAGRVTREFVYLGLETEFGAQLREIRAFDPDVLFVPGSFTDTSLVAAQARAAGLEATLLGGDGWSNRLLFKRGGPSRPAYHADLCAPVPDFAARYRRAFDQDADGCRALLSHDAVLALARALEMLGPLGDADLGARLADTRSRLRDALAAAELQGASGSIRFGPRGDVRRGVPIMRVEPAADGYGVRLERIQGEG